MKELSFYDKKLEEVCLRLEKIRDTEKNPYWNIHEKTACILRRFVCAAAPSNILEIGSSNGYSALNFARVLKTIKKGRIYTIESNKDRFLLAQKSIFEAEAQDYVTIYNTHAPECFYHEPFKSIKFDFVFLDAVKYQYQEIIEAVISVLSDKACIVIDNTDSHASELKDFKNYLVKQKNFFVFEMHVDDGITILIKK